jgi:hypothetical protein
MIFTQALNFVPLNVDIIKLFLESNFQDFSSMRNYDQEEVFFFLDLINSSKGCPNRMNAKVSAILPDTNLGIGYFEIIGEDVERRFRRVVANLDIIYESKSYMMPDDVRVEFKKALDLLKEAHSISVHSKNVQHLIAGIMLCVFLATLFGNPPPVNPGSGDSIFEYLNKNEDSPADEVD